MGKGLEEEVQGEEGDGVAHDERASQELDGVFSCCGSVENGIGVPRDAEDGGEDVKRPAFEETE